MKSNFLHIQIGDRQQFRLHYLDSGVPDQDYEETLLFVHGLGANVSIWEPCIEGLLRERDDLRCLAIDLPGQGASHVTETLDMNELIASIDYFLKALKIDKVCLVGHSFGTCLLLHTFNNPLHTTRIKQYYLLSPMGIQPMSELQKKMVKNIYDVKFLMKIGKYGSYISFKKYFFKYEKELDLFWKKIEKDIDRNPLQYYTAIHSLVNSVIDQYELKEARIFEKLNFFIGRNDVLIPYKSLGKKATLEDVKESCQSFFPNSEWTFLDDCGHYPQLEKPEAIVNLMMKNL